MARFFVEEAKDATCLTILDDRTGLRIVIEAEEFEELNRKLRYAIRNVRNYLVSRKNTPGDESCWEVVDYGEGIMRPCLEPRDKCRHAGNNNFEIPVKPGPCILPAKYLNRRKNGLGGPAGGKVEAQPGKGSESAS